MILKTVNTVKKLAEKILSDRANETETLKEKIAEETAAVETARQAMEAATAAGDVKAYQQAKAERRDAEDAREMHEARLTALNKKPLISEADYKKALSDIYAELAAADDQTRQKLAKLSDQMEAEAVELANAIDEANKVLAELQHDIYRDADRSKNKDGEIIPISQEEQRVDKWATVRWGRAGVRHEEYARYTGRRLA